LNEPLDHGGEGGDVVGGPQLARRAETAEARQAVATDQDVRLVDTAVDDLELVEVAEDGSDGGAHADAPPQVPAPAVEALACIAGP
jgi:hypothetical protein